MRKNNKIVIIVIVIIIVIKIVSEIFYNVIDENKQSFKNIMDLSTNDVIEMYDKNQFISNIKYNNMPIKITGKVKNVEKIHDEVDYICVTLDENNEDYEVVIEFYPQEEYKEDEKALIYFDCGNTEESILNLSVGDEISTVGYVVNDEGNIGIFYISARF